MYMLRDLKKCQNLKEENLPTYLQMFVEKEPRKKNSIFIIQSKQGANVSCQTEPAKTQMLELNKLKMPKIHEGS